MTLYDTEELVEILNIPSEELLDRFEDYLILEVERVTDVLEDNTTRIYYGDEDDDEE